MKRENRLAIAANKKWLPKIFGSHSFKILRVLIS